MQEIPKWVDGSRFGGFTVFSSRSRDDRANNRDGFDCGFLVPDSLSPLVRDVVHRPYWSGLLLPGALIFSVHFLHQYCIDRLDTHINRIHHIETQAFHHACSSKFPNKDLSVIACFDANVTLPADFEDVTGSSVLPPRPSHSASMQSNILSWLQQFNLRALNTFSDDSAAPSLWTCGWKRLFPERSQIDYVGVTPDISGCARPVNEGTLRDKLVLHQGMDHRLMLASLSLLQNPMVRASRQRTLKNWQPVDQNALREFQQITSSPEFFSTTLLNLEQSIFQIAQDIPYATPFQHTTFREGTKGVQITDIGYLSYLSKAAFQETQESAKESGAIEKHSKIAKIV